MQILHRDEHLVIKYSPASKFMYCYWRGFIAAKRIKELGAVIIQFVKSKRVSKVLNDNTGVVGPWCSIAPWVLKSWFPDMFSAGMEYFAWIMPKDRFALLSAKDAMPAVKGVKAFDSERDALVWLSNPVVLKNGVSSKRRRKVAPVVYKRTNGEALYDILLLSMQAHDPVAAAILQLELQRKV